MTQDPPSCIVLSVASISSWSRADVTSIPAARSSMCQVQQNSSAITIITVSSSCVLSTSTHPLACSLQPSDQSNRSDLIISFIIILSPTTCIPGILLIPSMNMILQPVHFLHFRIFPSENRNTPKNCRLLIISNAVLNGLF